MNCARHKGAEGKVGSWEVCVSVKMRILQEEGDGWRGKGREGGREGESRTARRERERAQTKVRGTRGARGCMTAGERERWEDRVGVRVGDVGALKMDRPAHTQKCDSPQDAPATRAIGRCTRRRRRLIAVDLPRARPF